MKKARLKTDLVQPVMQVDEFGKPAGNGSLVKEDFDFIGVEYPEPKVEKFIYKLGGATGTVVSVVKITYLDDKKSHLAMVESLPV